MKDNSVTPTYSETLKRFGLTTKPIREYGNGFSLWFSIENGVMTCLVTKTTKTDKDPLATFEVKNREHLDKLRNAKTLDEILTLTEVVN